MLVVRCAVATFGMVNVHCMVHVLGGDSVPAEHVVVAHVAPLGSSLGDTIPLRGMDSHAFSAGSGDRVTALVGAVLDAEEEDRIAGAASSREGRPGMNRTGPRDYSASRAYRSATLPKVAATQGVEVAVGDGGGVDVAVGVGVGGVVSSPTS
jgi:hypothetical protein